MSILRYIYLNMPAKSKAASSKPQTQRGGRHPRSYTPLSDALKQPFTFVDTEIAEGLQRHSLVGLLHAAISRQRRSDGEPLTNLLCALLVWPLMKVPSLHCFCAELCQILAGKVSVLYDLLGREDINWRGLSGELARRVHQDNELGPRSQRAFVVDDTSQARAGRKVEGTSCYYDPTEGRNRKGHQVLQLGLAGEKGFLPVEAQIVLGEKCAVDKPKDKPFRDQRSSAARDLRRAKTQTKHQLFRDLLRRALRAGFTALYVLADAWFGCKENILCCLENKLVGILQMKRGNLAYQYQGRSYTASQLYTLVQRRMQPKNRHSRCAYVDPVERPAFSAPLGGVSGRAQLSTCVSSQVGAYDFPAPRPRRQISQAPPREVKFRVVHRDWVAPLLHFDGSEHRRTRLNVLEFVMRESYAKGVVIL